jgi:DNA polymerase-3 subunit gamma/tau
MPPDRTEADSPEAAEKQGEYVVVARRYRPQTFEELVGQEHVARALSGAITSNRVGHAYLFTGARGVGKTSAARILAKALNCQNGPSPTPCNQCDACQSISAGEDVDVLEIDGASNRGIDEMRELRQNVNFRPSRVRFKIYIIDEVHMLTREAFNALLKTLEEPPEHVKFIFCTTEPEKIPITILSRCQRFDFAGIQTASITGRLRQIVETEGVQADEEALEVLARRAAGSMRDSQSLLEQLLAFGGERITVTEVHAMLGTAGGDRLGALVTHLVKRNAAAALADLDGALAEGVDVGQLLDQLVGYFRDVMTACVGCDQTAFLHAYGDEQQRVRQAAEQLGVETVLAIMQIIDQTLARLRYSTHRRTLAELALVRICKLEDLDSLSSLLGQLRHDGTNATIASAPKPPPARSTTSVRASSITPEPPDDSRKKKPDVAAESAEISSQAVSSPANSTPLTPETASQVWKQVLSRLTDMIADHAGFCERVAIPAPNRLVVSFRAKYTACKTYCERPDQTAKIERVLGELTGKPVRVEFELLDDASTEADGDSPQRFVSQRERIIEKSQHPLVRRVCEVFDAHPVKVEGQ